ncbi:MAG: hydrogenase expression/formation protein [Gammaproteobacteria bacterium]
MSAGWRLEPGWEAGLRTLAGGVESPPRADQVFGSSPPGCLAQPEGAALVARCRAAPRLLRGLAERLAEHRLDRPNFTLPLDGLPDGDRELVGQVLGCGEVRFRLDGVPRIAAQESVMAGVWRVFELPEEGGCSGREWIEVGAIPEVFRRRAEGRSPLGLIPPPPEGVMNAMPVLAELRDTARDYRSGGSAHVVNLTLVPMTPADLELLRQVLGNGGVSAESRGYGACRVHATGCARIWSVQYFNAMDALILDTVEVCDLPAAVAAAQEDIEDSAKRLTEILDAYLE